MKHLFAMLMLFLSLQVNAAQYSVTLEWGAVTSDINGQPTKIIAYSVYASENKGEFSQIAEVDGNNITYVHSGEFKSGTIFTYYVLATDAYGLTSDQSNHVQAQVLPGRPSATLLRITGK